MDLSLQSDMDNIFLKSGFQETVVYTPASGAAVSIPAIVDRSTLRQTDSTVGRSNKTERRQFDIEILVSTADVAIVTVREDLVTLARRPGMTGEQFLVTAVIASDAGAWRLGLGS